MDKTSRPARKPKHWPPGVQYLLSSILHRSVSRETRDFIVGTSSAPVHCSQPPVAIRAISDSSHPAFRQYGLFAAKKIAAKSHIIDYIGEIHSDERPSSDYDLSLWRSETVNVGIDAAIMGNEARFTNDYRGIGEKPNAVFKDSRTANGELRIAIWSSTEIKKGEEILVSYGKQWWRERDATF
ncbi:SET domain protein [Mycena floridula]|nr:SET domain protein [Mycena floridula]